MAEKSGFGALIEGDLANGVRRCRAGPLHQILAQRTRNSRPDSGRVQFGIVKTSAQAVGWWTQSGQILRIKGAKRGVDRVPDADNSSFHRRTQERNPKVTAKEQLRPTRRRGTARMRRAVTFHPFRRYHCWIKDLVFIWTKPVVLLHPTHKTRTSPRLDVGFCGKKPVPARVASPIDMVCLVVTKRFPDAIGLSPITRFTVRLIAERNAHLRFSVAMPLLTPIELSSIEKLEILQRLDRYRKWQSLEDKRYCLTCGQIIDGREVLVVGGTRGTGPLRLVCPTRGCHSIPMDWVIPTDEVLARMSILQDEETLSRKAVARPREKFTVRLRKFATQFRRAA